MAATMPPTGATPVTTTTAPTTPEAPATQAPATQAPAPEAPTPGPTAPAATPALKGGRARRAKIRSGPPRWRGRILPKTILGITALILAFSLGASLSGVVLYSLYAYRFAQTDDKLNTFIGQFSGTVKTASDAIKAQQAAATAQIQSQLEPIRKIAAEGQTLQTLVAKAAPALYFVHTLDDAGQPSVGTAFAVASDSHQTLLVTSFNTVRAATKRPGPDVFVRKGTTETKVTVYTWQEERDLALIVLAVGSQPKLAFAAQNPTIGDRVFALSGLGAQGAAISQGFVSDVSSAGIQHDAAIGPAFQGGPLVNSDGQILGVSSRTYSPLGFATDAVWFAVPAKATCEKVLSCPNNTPSGAGTQRSG